MRAAGGGEGGPPRRVRNATRPWRRHTSERDGQCRRGLERRLCSAALPYFFFASCPSFLLTDFRTSPLSAIYY